MCLPGGFIHQPVKGGKTIVFSLNLEGNVAEIHLEMFYSGRDSKALLFYSTNMAFSV